MEFKDIVATVGDDFAAVDRFILKRLDTQVPLIREVSEYIVNSGGKRLRPLMALLAARVTGYQGDRHINIAAIIELLHTSTLLHDDVVDESSLRRGRPTVNAVWGNAAAVLVGDFLISRSYQLTVELHDMRLMDILADGTNVISEGEVLQLLNVRDVDTTEARYMQVIHAKTAKMFESAAEAGAVLGARDEADAARLRRILGGYAKHVGIAFQLIDDVLDYDGDSAELGKNVGDDLAEGKPTLPLIHAMRAGAPADAELVREAIRNGGLDRLAEIIAAVRRSGGLEYTRKLANAEADAAIALLQELPASRYRDALAALAHLAVHRTH
ncbi:MAG: polyprenyl synthetase family protein [Gammaproteobacteria bacterium]